MLLTVGSEDVCVSQVNVIACGHNMLYYSRSLSIVSGLNSNVFLQTVCDRSFSLANICCCTVYYKQLQFLLLVENGLLLLLGCYSVLVRLKTS